MRNIFLFLFLLIINVCSSQNLTSGGKLRPEQATAPQYTYDNFVCTDDVEQLFSKASRMNLKPLFDFYLRTVQKLEVHVKAMPNNQYKIELQNFDGALPLDIVTDKGKERSTIDKHGIIVKSAVQPQIDPDCYYLKKLIIE